MKHCSKPSEQKHIPFQHLCHSLKRQIAVIAQQCQLGVHDQVGLVVWPVHAFINTLYIYTPLLFTLPLTRSPSWTLSC